MSSAVSTGHVVESTDVSAFPAEVIEVKTGVPHHHFGQREGEHSVRCKHRTFCRRVRLGSLGSLEGMKVDIINPQVDRFIFPVAHDVIVLSSDRLRFLNLGCDTGRLSFEMSCSFTVQVPAQLDLLRKVTCIKAFKNDFQLLPKELDSGALDGEELLPIELLECGATPAGALDGEELLVVELLKFGTNPAGAFEVEVTNPSCKRVSSKSAGSTASPTPPFRRVRLRQQRHRSSGQGMTAKTTPPSGDAQKPWGGHPSC